MANRLKELREACGLSLSALADRACTSRQQVSMLEQGKRRLTVEWLIRLADALGCHPWSIVSRAPPSPLTDNETLLVETLLVRAFRDLDEVDQTLVLKEAIVRSLCSELNSVPRQEWPTIYSPKRQVQSNSDGEAR